jgi:hypothetical protein
MVCLLKVEGPTKLLNLKSQYESLIFKPLHIIFYNEIDIP